jgi:GntR family transcriptional regulator, transcriptional repressor for pyruvate dehydrogenase complex
MTDLPADSWVFGLFNRDLLPDRIAERLVSLIAERKLRPGDKLPSERDLAAMMQVSRPSLREALRALDMMKIIEVRHGSGTYVASLRPERLVEHFDFVFSLDDSTFTNVLDARAMLEPSLAAAAAQNATDSELSAIGACMERLVLSVHDPKLFLEADLELHQLITAAVHNQIIARFMSTLGRLGLASRMRTVALKGVREQSLKDHQAIVDALFRRDAEAAASIMQKHIKNINKSLNENVNNESNESNQSEGIYVTNNNVG